MISFIALCFKVFSLPLLSYSHRVYPNIKRSTKTENGAARRDVDISFNVLWVITMFAFTFYHSELSISMPICRYVYQTSTYVHTFVIKIKPFFSSMNDSRKHETFDDLLVSFDWMKLLKSYFSHTLRELLDFVF